MKEYTVYWRYCNSAAVYEVNIQSNGTLSDVITDTLDHLYNEERLLAEDVDICHVEVVR